MNIYINQGFVRTERAVFLSTWDIYFFNGGNCSSLRSIKAYRQSPNSGFRNKFQDDGSSRLYMTVFDAVFTSRLNSWKCSIPNKGSHSNNSHSSFSFQQLLMSSWSSSEYQNNSAEQKVNMTLSILQMKKWKCWDTEHLNKNCHCLYPYPSALWFS